jgi:iron complex outermembrane recepter protein
VVTARGFNGSSAEQNFSNKLLVLIDGRSVYSPLYSGVYWDVQQVLPEDVDRIEVISGPGATLWGANAVNGVINIITKTSSETQGGVIDATAGNLGSSLSVQYGGKIGDDLAYRLYATDFYDRQTATSTGAPAHDAWSKPQGGFRLDWTPTTADSVMVEGDIYGGAENQLDAPNQDITGRNLTTRWNHTWADGSNLQVEAYYDHTSRSSQDGGSFWVDAYDLDVQHSFQLGDRNRIVWGGGLRISSYDIVGTAALYFTPNSRTLDLSNFFVQDSITVARPVTLVLGLKLEDDPYSGLNVLPSARLSWKLNDSTLVWAAASRAIRAPTPFDRDLDEKIGSLLFLTGGADFQPETLSAYELGVRAQPFSRLSFSVSTFYNSYDDLRSIEFNPKTLLPLEWGNALEGFTYGVEAWGDLQVTPWWRLSPGLSGLSEHFNFKPGQSGLLSALTGVGVQQLGDDPDFQASLRSSMNFGSKLTLDADLRYVSALPNPHVPSYVDLSGRIGWRISERVVLSLSGFNLLSARHQELPAPQADAVPRSFVSELQWRF